MKRLIILMILIPGLKGQAQISINTDFPAEYLVNEVLLGKGIDASNIRVSGEPIQFAEFTNQNTNLDIPCGIVMVTGDATISSTFGNGASGGEINTRGNSTSAFIQQGFEPTLSDLVGGRRIFDVAVIEFDFVPAGQILEFNYVFASEEYHEYNCTEFNDVFGFFLSGPGYPDPINIARLPGSDEVVSINTVNNGVVGSEDGKIENCSPPSGSLSNTAFFKDNVGGSYLEYDGLTTGLKARAEVVPCETYHIKLAIADVSDRRLDSGVFFEKKSFRSVAIEAFVITPNNDSTMIEGCTHATVVFSLPQIHALDLTLGLDFLGNASRDVDYTDNFPGEIFFPAGQNTTSFELTSIADNIFERSEDLILVYDAPFCQLRDTLVIHIEDESRLEVEPKQAVIEPGVETTFPLQAFFGEDPEGTFTWSPATGLTTTSGPNTLATVSDTITYTVTYEEGSCVQTAQVKITANPEFGVYIPNAFSPNGDDVNDLFVANFIDGTDFEYRIRIFDRWGALVYRFSGFNRSGEIGWDGLSGGKEAAPGVYMYVLDISVPGEGTRVVSGSVTLMR